MLFVGAIWGALVGLVICIVVAKAVPRPEPNNRSRVP